MSSIKCRENALLLATLTPTYLIRPLLPQTDIEAVPVFRALVELGTGLSGGQGSRLAF